MSRFRSDSLSADCRRRRCGVSSAVAAQRSSAVNYLIRETGEVYDRVAAPVTSAVAEHNYAAAVAARIIAHLRLMGCVHWWAATFEFDEKTKHGGGVLSVSCMVCMCARV